MKHTLLTFTRKILNESASGEYGITHVEDLDIEAFLRVIERLHELEAVQKLDGANLRVGLDDKGELFTSREQKGGHRFYDERDFPKNPSYDGFKAAHTVLEKVEGVFQDILSPGESVNLEIIYGPQPNTVFYGKDNLNYIALLEILPGDDPSVTPDQKKLDQLIKQLKDKVITVRSLFSDTPDGRTIVRAPRVTDWKFTTSDIVPPHEIESVDFRDELRGLKRYLRQDNAAAAELGMDLTNFEVLKNKSTKLSDERRKITDTVMNDYKLPIKKKLLELVGKLKPSLRGEVDDDGAYHGIEGIIFTDPKTREKFKVVNKDVFTAINKFNYQVRNAVSSKIMSTDENLPIESRGGIVGQARARCVRLFGLGTAVMPAQLNKEVEKFKGDTREDTVDAIAKSLRQLKFESVRRKMQAIYISAIDDLDDALDAFKTNGDTYELEVDNGKKIKYTKEIKRRTLMSFAEARRSLVETLTEIRRSKEMHDLIELFLERQLDKVHEVKR